MVINLNEDEETAWAKVSEMRFMWPKFKRILQTKLVRMKKIRPRLSMWKHNIMLWSLSYKSSQMRLRRLRLSHWNLWKKYKKFLKIMRGWKIVGYRWWVKQSCQTYRADYTNNIDWRADFKVGGIAWRVHWDDFEEKWYRWWRNFKQS